MCEMSAIYNIEIIYNNNLTWKGNKIKNQSSQNNEK